MFDLTGYGIELWSSCADSDRFTLKFVLDEKTYRGDRVMSDDWLTIPIPDNTTFDSDRK